MSFTILGATHNSLHEDYESMRIVAGGIAGVAFVGALLAGGDVSDAFQPRLSGRTVGTRAARRVLCTTSSCNTVRMTAAPVMSDCRTRRLRRRTPCPPLRGRVDSARAEELLAGLGYTVGSSFGDDTKGPARQRRRRGRGGSSKGTRGEGTPTEQRRGREASGDVEDTASQGDEDLVFLQRHDYDVSAEDRLYFERNGHVVTRELLTEKQLDAIRPHIQRGFELRELEALRQKVSVWFGEEAAVSLKTAPELRARLKRIAPDDVPFLQVFNMFRKDGPHRAAIEKLVLSPRLGHVAAQLLGCGKTRVYQDSTFVKRPGDGPTRWHSDLNMAPLDCNDFITAWIPMTPVPARKEGGSPLMFASRSHRDFALNHWQEERWQKDLSGRYVTKDHAPLAAGDVTWHHGWTLHTSPGNSRAEPRTAIAVSYFRDGTRVLSSSAKRAPDPEDKWSYGDWIKDVSPGEYLDHPAVPLVWTGAVKTSSSQ